MFYCYLINNHFLYSKCCSCRLHLKSNNSAKQRVKKHYLSHSLFSKKLCHSIAERIKQHFCFWVSLSSPLSC